MVLTRRALAFSVAVLALFVLVALPVRADTPFGNVSGTVTETTGQTPPSVTLRFQSEFGDVSLAESGPVGEYGIALIAGSYEVSYRDAYGLSAGLGSLEVVAGEFQEIDYVLRPATNLSGTVREESGYRQSGWLDFEETTEPWVRSVAVASDGTFASRLLNGTYEVTFRTNGGLSIALGEWEVRGANQGFTMLIEDPGTIYIRVMDSAGNPVVANIRFESVYGAYDVPTRDDAFLGIEIRPGEHKISVGFDNEPLVPQTVTVNTVSRGHIDYDLIVDPGWTIRGTVYDIDADDNRILNACLSFEADGYTRTAESNSDGYYEARGFASGIVTINSPCEGVTLEPVVVDLNGDVLVDLYAAVQPTLWLGVFTQSGEPIDECVLVYSDASEYAVADELIRDGEVFLRLDPGTYDIEVGGCQGVYGRKVVEDVVVELGFNSLFIELVEGGALTGYLYDELDGSVLTGGYIELYRVPSDGDFSRESMLQQFVGYRSIDFDGMFELSGLASGDYLLWAYPTSDHARGFYPGVAAEAAQRIRIRAGLLTEIAFALAPSGDITGRVAGAHVCMSIHDLDGQLVRFEYIGSAGYEVSGVPEGNYRLRFEQCDPGGQSATGFQPVWFGNTFEMERGAVVEVRSGVSTAGVDAPLSTERLIDAPAAVISPDGAWDVYDEVSYSLWFGAPGDVGLLGDWDGDGVETPAMYRPSNGFVYLTNSRDTATAEAEFFFGLESDIPLAGDWDGDGRDSFGVYRPGEGKVYLRNSLSTGFADVEYFFGNPGDVPFAGDFDGDGTDSVGLHRASSGLVYFRNAQSSGVAESEFFYGNPGDVILAGDWDGDGDDTVGIYRPSDERFYLQNENRLGTADIEFTWPANGRRVVS